MKVRNIDHVTGELVRFHLDGSHEAIYINDNSQMEKVAEQNFPVCQFLSHFCLVQTGDMGQDLAKL